jgi:NADPH:quinone reductase-like Zn-dependent oxidoreductase
MKVWRYSDSVSSKDSQTAPGLFQAEIEPPKPKPGELLIRVQAAGVTVTEWMWYPTTHTKSGQIRRNAIPGHEFSGIVVAIAAGATAEADLAVGQEVFGMNDWFADGATAEFCCALPSAVARKPARLTHAEAASVPISALTAWQGLFDRAKLEPGERVLIHGGSGAVGVFAIQLAHWRGARVVTTASVRHRDFLLRLGAQQVIDYHTERFEDVARGVDVVFDTVGGSTLQRSWDVLGPQGRLVTIAASSEPATEERTKRAFLLVEANRQQLGEIAGLLDSGQLQPVVNAVVPFAQAEMAYAAPAKPSRGCGKMVVDLSAAN